jgi:DNA-binding NarL/FixJ family response regulator
LTRLPGRQNGAVPIRIVVCDDQPAFRMIVSTVLRLEADLEVVGEGGDGQQAIELAVRLKPDVLLLDIAMPVMDGLEALPHIRAGSPDTKVVMLTGVANHSVRQSALDGGAALFLEKGVDIEELVRAVVELSRGD